VPVGVKVTGEHAQEYGVGHPEFANDRRGRVEEGCQDGRSIERDRQHNGHLPTERNDSVDDVCGEFQGSLLHPGFEEIVVSVLEGCAEPDDRDVGLIWFGGDPAVRKGVC
jgi:hypothetical protein